MQIVVDIPENTYKQIQALARSEYFEHDICGSSMRRIANGTPLSKGHGRLIDADKLVEIAEKIEEDGATLCIDKSEDLETFLDDEVPTVLDAESEE